MPKKPKAIPDGFSTVPAAAKLLGCSVQNIRANYLPKLSGDDVIPGRPARVRFAALIDLIVERQVAERTRAVAPVSDDPLLAAGGDSPGLERYRLAKAKHAELDLQHRMGELVEVGKCRDILARWASLLRRAGERIGKASPEAARIQNETLDELAGVIAEFDQ